MKRGIKNQLMRATNLLLYLSFCALVGTGALLTWKLVPGSQGGRGLTVLGMTRHEWSDLHFWTGTVCVSTTLAHIILNWPWLKKIASSGKAWRLALGLLVGAVLIFGTYALPLEQSHREDRPTQEIKPSIGDKQHHKGW